MKEFIGQARRLPVLLAAWLIAAGAPGAPAAAQPATPSVTSTATAPAGLLAGGRRPRIVLVLGGGGARGFAHIGVLEELEKRQIPVDAIAGTSMGAVVGSLAAQGRSAAEIVEVAHKIDWTAVFDDRVRRADLSFRRKSEERSILLGYRLSFNNGKMVLPKGLLGGQRLFATLQEILADDATVDDFDTLPIPYRAVATNIENGEGVVLSQGDFATAVYASMAIPGAFPPIERDGLLLVDGGLADNVPIDVGRAMGADVLIVVNVSSSPLKRDQINNALNVLNQMTLLLGYETIQRQIGSLSGRDVLITPSIEGIGVSSFELADTGIERGRVAARAVADKLAPLALNDADWAAYQAAKRARIDRTPVVIDTVKIANTSSVPDRRIEPLITTKPGDTFNGEVMARDVENIFALDDFSRVSYDITGTTGSRELLVDARGDPTTRRYFQFGLQVGTDFGRGSTFQFGIGYTDRDFLGTGAEWRGFANLGGDIEIDVSLYQRFGQFFVEPIARFRRYDTLIVQSGTVPESGQLQVVAGGAALDGGLVFGNWGELRAGFNLGGIRPLAGSIDIGVPSQWNRAVSWDVGFTYDTLDSVLFPREGGFGTISYTSQVTALGGQFAQDEFRVNLVKPFSWGRSTLILGGRFGTTDGAVNDFIGQFQLGGFLNLSGLSRNSLIGQQEVLGRVIFYHRFSDKSPIGDLPLYFGGSFETGNVYTDLSDITFDSLRTAVSAFIAADTPIGPAFFAYGRSSGSNAFYLVLGRVF